MDILLLITTLILFFAYIINTNGIIIDIDESENKLMPFNNDALDIKLVFPSKKVNKVTTQVFEEDSPCLLEYYNYLDCFSKKGYISVECKVDSKECYTFFTDPLSVLPACRNTTKSERDYISHFIKYTYKFSRLMCENDGKCPLYQEMDRFNKQDDNFKYYIPSTEAITENCKYNECTKLGIDIFEELTNFYDTLDKVIKNPVLSNETDAETIYKNYKKAKNRNDAIEESLKVMRDCLSGTITINKTISGVIINSFIFSLIFYLFMNN